VKRIDEEVPGFTPGHPAGGHPGHPLLPLRHPGAGPGRELLSGAHALLEQLFSKKIEIPPEDLAALPVYIELLNDEDAEVQEHAALTIARMGPPVKAAITRLTALLQDDNHEVRRSTVVAIGFIEQRADLVLPLLKDQEPFVRCRVANLLGEIGQKSEAVISALREALNDSDEDVRVEAAHALKRLNGAGD